MKNEHLKPPTIYEPQSYKWGEGDEFTPHIPSVYSSGFGEYPFQEAFRYQEPEKARIQREAIQLALEEHLATVDVTPHELIADSRVYGTGKGRYYPTDTYFDSTHGIIRTSAAGPLVLATFEVTDDLLALRQLQSMSCYSPQTGLGRWERDFIGILEGFARKLSIRHMMIQSAANNTWVRIGRMNQQHAYLRYDVSARRAKYTCNPDTGDYTKTLK